MRSPETDRLRKVGVYKIGCRNCSKVERTSRSTKIRAQEHTRHTKTQAIDKTAIAAHFREEEHRHKF